MRAYIGIALLALAACGGGGGASNAGVPPPQGNGCDGSCATAASFLTVADVELVIAQAVAEAKAENVQATVAVVDRVGNVLAVFRMGAALTRSVVIASSLDANGSSVIDGGLEGLRLPAPTAAVAIDDQAAIAKAITGAYLSTEGNAFSSRTASQIVQQHFNPGEHDQPGGPLFGVQFSQLPCSDLALRWDGTAPSVGPQRSPLGLSADPGGFPLYKDGTPVGGVGVIADGVYGLDASIADSDRNADEMIAYAATFGFAAPRNRRGDQIAVDGKTLRFSDVEFGDLAADPSVAPAFATLTPADGQLVAVTHYVDAAAHAGVAFGQPASGIRADAADFPGLDAFVLVDAGDAPRYAPRGGTDGGALGADVLTIAEVQALLAHALAVANRARAQIRRPLDSPARVTISVVDTAGEILGIVRSRDAPVFGIDVSLQKARTAAFYSSAGAAAFLRAMPDAGYRDTTDPLAVARTVAIGGYVDAVQAFLSDANALEDGATAFTDRAGGNLSRPNFPDGLDGRAPGPFSKPPGQWSPFSTGLQLDLVLNAIVQHVVSTASAETLTPDVGQTCPGVDDAFAASQSSRIVANGTQTFPGSVPIYRGDVLVGGLGVSGDGVDQDDMIAFLGLYEGGQALGGALDNAPKARRADQLTPQGVRLRYVQCPQAPYLNSNADNVCEGK